MPKAKRPHALVSKKAFQEDVISKRAKSSDKPKPKPTEHAAPKAKATPKLFWKAFSIIDKQASFAIQKIIQADESKKRGVTIKSLTLGPDVKEKKATYAVTCQVLKYLPILKPVLEHSKLLKSEEKLGRYTAYVLVYEFLFGQGFKAGGPAERFVKANKEKLQASLDLVMKEQGAKRPEDLLPSQPDMAPHPRWARVNTLKHSVDRLCAMLRDPAKHWGANHASKKVTCTQDDLLSDVLRFPSGTDLHDHPAVKDGSLILQSKSSCMPAHALQPQPGWTVVDCCAAPGNKTTHVAAMMQGKGRVFAFDKDGTRLARLQQNARLSGADSVIAAEEADFLSLDPESEQFKDVCGVILDPSCSGSGTVYTRMDHLLPSQQAGPSGQEDPRVAQLAAFQTAALRHALRFPSLQRLVYSTCSVHQAENEDVVAAVLDQATELGFQLADPFPSWHRRGMDVVQGADKLVRVDPVEDGTDGFFVAVFEKAGSQQKLGTPHSGKRARQQSSSSVKGKKPQTGKGK